MYIRNKWPKSWCRCVGVKNDNLNFYFLKDFVSLVSLFVCFLFVSGLQCFCKLKEMVEILFNFTN